MAGGVGQAHLVVLTLHFDEELTELLERGGTHRGVVDPGAAAAGAFHGAAKHDFVLARQAKFVEQRVDGVARRGLETGGDAGLRGAVADQTGVAAGA